MAAITVEQALKSGLFHQRAGRLGEAEAIYRQILASQPRHADALYLLGSIDLARKRYAEALEKIGEAIAQSPANAGYHCDLGLTYQQLKPVRRSRCQLPGSVTMATELRRGEHNNLGNIFFKPVPMARCHHPASARLRATASERRYLL